MTTTKFKINLIPQMTVEIFGSDQLPDPLLLKSIPQKTKYELKKLGNALNEELKTALTEMKELRDKFSEDFDEKDKDGLPVLDKDGKPVQKKRIKKEHEEEFLKAARDIEDMEVEIQHYDFTERDFIDSSTGGVVSSKSYYNLLDRVIYEKQESAAEVV